MATRSLCWNVLHKGSPSSGYCRPEAETENHMSSQRGFPVHILLCVAPWLVPLCLWIIPHPLPGHIEPDDLRRIKLAAIWSLCVVFPGLAWSLIDWATTRRLISAAAAAAAAGYLVWYPWDGLAFVLKL